MFGIPVPTPLKRAGGAWQEEELKGQKALIFKGFTQNGTLATILGHAGAELVKMDEEGKVAFLIFDARGIANPSDLEALYQAFHKKIGALAANGRVLILADEEKEVGDVAQRAAVKALEGFTRALAKEVGRKGSTANMLMVSASIFDSELEWLATPVVYLLSKRSAFISGQVFHIRSEAVLPENLALAKSLTNKVALVTGGSRGIGKAIAKKLAQEGATVIILDRPQESAAAETVAKAINGKVLLGDVTEEGIGQKIEKYCLEQFGGLDILVHNAGVTRDKTLRNMDIGKWQQVLNINLQAVLGITGHLLEQTLRDEGRIICLSSISGIAGNVGQTNYSASKAGLIGFSESLAPILADRGITVNAIAPGFIETQMTAKIPFMTRTVGRKLSNLAQGGLPEDVADLATFLAMPGTSGITGQAIRVCGGALIGK